MINPFEHIHGVVHTRCVQRLAKGLNILLKKLTIMSVVHSTRVCLFFVQCYNPIIHRYSQPRSTGFSLLPGASLLNLLCSPGQTYGPTTPRSTCASRCPILVFYPDLPLYGRTPRTHHRYCGRRSPSARRTSFRGWIAAMDASSERPGFGCMRPYFSAWISIKRPARPRRP